MGTLLSFGSMVQKGKFSAAAWLFVSTLKNVDFLKMKTAVRPTRQGMTVSSSDAAATSAILLPPAHRQKKSLRAEYLDT